MGDSVVLGPYGLALTFVNSHRNGVVVIEPNLVSVIGYVMGFLNCGILCSYMVLSAYSPLGGC